MASEKGHRFLSVQEFVELESITSAHATVDWLAWIISKGYSGNELITEILPGYHGVPYWIHLMTRMVRVPDWHRILSMCNVHACDNMERNAIFYCGYVPEALPHLLRAGVNWKLKGKDGCDPLIFIAWEVEQGKARLDVLHDIIDLHIKHNTDRFVYLESSPHKYYDRIRHYLKRALARRAACRAAARTLYAIVKRRMRYPRDVATLLAQRLWVTRWSREDWKPVEPSERNGSV